MLRKILVVIAGSFFSLWLILMVLATAVVMSFTPHNLKDWLNDSNAYDTIVDDIIAQSETLNKPEDEEHENPLNDPGLQAAARETLNPGLLRATAEEIIDGTTPWLEGTADRPDFSINLAAIKNDFADRIGTYARTRYAALPVCQAGQVPKSTDILSLDCQPPGFNPEAEIQKSITELKTSDEFLSDTALTAEDIGAGGEGEDKRPLYQRLEKLPGVYEKASMVPFVLGGLALISALIILLASTEKRRGVRRIMTTFYVSGGLLIVTSWLVKYAFDRGMESLTRSADDSKGLQRTAVAVLDQVQQSLNSIILRFGLAFVAIAALLTLYLVLTRHKAPKEAETPVSTEKSAEPETETKEAAEPKAKEEKKPAEAKAKKSDSK